MNQEEFREKVGKLQKSLSPKRRSYEGPIIFADSEEKVAFFTIVIQEGKSFRETVHVVWAGDNGNLQQEDVLSLIGFFKTSLDVRLENEQILLNILCEDGAISKKFDFRIPLNIIGEWCRKQRPDKEIIIN